MPNRPTEKRENAETFMTRPSCFMQANSRYQSLQDGFRTCCRP